MKILHTVAFILLVIGGLNWLLVGIGNWDLVAILFSAGSILSKIVYILVGLSAIYLIFTHKKDCKTCSTNSSATTM